MRIESAEQVRNFLADYSEGVALTGRPPQALHLIAQAALRGTPAAGDRSTAEDVVAELLLRELEERRAGRKAVTWRTLPAGQAAAIVRRRCRQLAVERLGGWNVLKQLRAHVAAALEDLPVAPEAAPTSVLQSDRLSAERVAQAAAWALTQLEPERRTVRAVTALLRERYFGGAIELDVEAFAQPGEMAPDDYLDAARVSALLLGELGEELSRVLGRHLDDRSFKEIAREESVALTTAFERCRTAKDGARTAFQAHPCSRNAAALALGLVAAASR